MKRHTRCEGPWIWAVLLATTACSGSASFEGDMQGTSGDPQSASSGPVPTVGEMLPMVMNTTMPPPGPQPLATEQPGSEPALPSDEAPGSDVEGEATALGSAMPDGQDPPNGEAPAPTDDESTDDELTDDELTDDELTDDALTDDELTDDALTDDALTDDALTDDALTDDALTDDALTDDEPGPAMEPEPVPMTDHCAAVADWDPEWVQWEQEVLLLVNEARSAPRSCGSQGDFDAAEPLLDNPLLTCSSRLHSLDMFERDFFDHVNPDGVEPSERVTDAGYEWMATGENIAYGYDSPQAVVDGWLDSDGHCSNIMNDVYLDLGVGYYPGNLMERFSSDRHYWTQNFGTERSAGGFGPGGGFGFGGD